MTTDEKLSPADPAFLLSRFRHTLLQPTAAIKTILMTGRANGLSAQQWDDTAGKILRANAELSRDLELLALFTTFEHSKPPTGPQMLSVASLIERSLERYSTDDQRRIQLNDSGAHANVRGAPNFLIPAIDAILTNSLEFSSETVELYTHIVSEDIFIGVRDCGRGLPAEIIEHGPKAFAVYGAEQSSRPSRLGLGLTVARNVARHLGGELLLSNRNDGTTDVSLQLPLAVH